MAQKTLKTLHFERSNFIWIYVSALILAIFGAKIQTFTKRYKQDKYNFWHKIQIRYFGGFSNAWPPEKGFARIFLFHWFLSVVGNVSKSNPLHKAKFSQSGMQMQLVMWCSALPPCTSMYPMTYDPPTVYCLLAYTMPYPQIASAETQTVLEKMDCKICKSPKATIHNFYGATSVCHSCRGFFMRSVHSGLYKVFCQGHASKCQINSNNRKSCKKCRYEKCLEVGMKIAYVWKSSKNFYAKNIFNVDFCGFQMAKLGTTRRIRAFW